MVETYSMKNTDRWSNDEKGICNLSFQPCQNDVIIDTRHELEDKEDKKTIKPDYEDNCLTERLKQINTKLKELWDKNAHKLKLIFLAALFVAFNVYWGFAISISWSSATTWCEGVKFLTLMTACVYAGLLYFFLLKKVFRKCSSSSPAKKLERIFSKCFGFRYSGIISFVVVLLGIFIFIIIDAGHQKDRIVSFGGVVALLAFGFIFSKHPHKIKIRHVTWGISLQFIFALMILRWPVGRETFICLGNKLNDFFAYTDYGSGLVFGYLATGDLVNGNATISKLQSENITIGEHLTAVDLALPKQMTVFAFKILPVICFFSFFVSILYYYGIMQWLVLKVGWVLQVTIGTTAAESLSAAANIFLGQTEAPLVIQPYLSLMTKSELHAIMTGGFATIAGSVMAAYIRIGISASHLLSASVMSAPAALAYSKLFYPETEESKTKAADIKIEKGKERNALEAATVGVAASISLVANIAANLLAFTAFIYFVDGIFGWFGSLVGWSYFSLTYIMSKVFMPLAYLMGIQWEECELVGRLIGIKTIINEFVAYDQLSQIREQLSPRSEVIATYALCGFSNLASIGIQLGGLGAMAPNRLKDLASVAIRAVISGSAACFLTACIAGALMTGDNIPIRA